MSEKKKQPRRRIVHRAKHIRGDGAASALCFKRTKAIDMIRATWTTRDEAVTCPKCRKAMANRGSMVR